MSCLSLIFKSRLLHQSYCSWILGQNQKHSFSQMHIVSQYASSFFLLSRAFSTFFYTMTITSCLVSLFFLLKCFPFYYFACLTSIFTVVHSSVVFPHMPWYWQNLLPLYSSLEALSLEYPNFTDFLFLDPYIEFFLFCEGILGGIDFSKFSILVSKNSVIEWIEPSK